MKIVNSLFSILLLATVLNAKSFDLSKTECSKYLGLSSSELAKEIKSAFSNKEGTIIPFCLQLKSDVTAFEKSKGIYRVNSLNKIETTLKELEDFGVKMKAMEKHTGIEYKKLNIDLRKKGFIPRNDMETIYVLLTQENDEVLLEKLKRKNNSLHTKKEVFTKDEFIKKYPSFALSKGIKVETKDIKNRLIYEITVDYPQVRNAASSSPKVLITDIKLKKGDIVYGFTRGQDNKQVSTNYYNNVYIDDEIGKPIEFWLNKKFLILKEIK